MTSREPASSCEHREDAAPYVLGALEHDEHERFRQHLAECARCRTEVTELQPVVDVLPASAPLARAPKELRARILSTVRSEAELLGAAGPGADHPPKRAFAGRLPRLAFAGAGVALAALVAVLIAVSGGSSKLLVSPGTAPAGATASLRQRDGHAELIVKRMPPPALGRIYEVWLLKRGAAEPAPTTALFSVTNGGSGAVDVPNLHGVKEVLVTSEPAGGSLHPTSAPVIRVALGRA